MQVLFLTVTLSLMAALQAQGPQSFLSEKKQNVSLGRAGVGKGCDPLEVGGAQGAVLDVT